MWLKPSRAGLWASCITIPSGRQVFILVHGISDMSERTARPHDDAGLVLSTAKRELGHRQCRPLSSRLLSRSDVTCMRLLFRFPSLEHRRAVYLPSITRLSPQTRNAQGG
ncbi:hypothetical protein BDV32DRAFT_82707 [Aspergillus pseudonomiae]|nr:hypothetical protein BDV32DRAFT_82707 [Aspergillus pseudonomiae]